MRSDGIANFLRSTKTTPKYKAPNSTDLAKIKSITSALTLWVASTPHPAYRMIPKPTLQHLVDHLHQGFDMPSRMAIARRVISLGGEVSQHIAQTLQQ